MRRREYRDEGKRRREYVFVRHPCPGKEREGKRRRRRKEKAGVRVRAPPVPGEGKSRDEGKRRREYVFLRAVFVSLAFLGYVFPAKNH